MKACRVLVNTPSAVGGIGDMYNELIPSLTLGCGSYGRNSISHNVSATDLLNIKTIAKRRNNTQIFKVPAQIYFEENAIMSLTTMDKIEKVMIVCDPGMVEFGYTKTVENVLRQRTEQPQIKIFSEVEPNPSTNTVYKGLEMMVDFNRIQSLHLVVVQRWMLQKQCGCSLNTLRHHSSVLNKSS